jgi:hypothetical protein
MALTRITKVGGNSLEDPLNFTGSVNATGIVTATGFTGNLTGNVNSSGVSTFSTILVGTGVTISGGIVTATSFSGNLTGTASTATGLSGTPDITVGIITATNVVIGGGTTQLVVTGNAKVTGVVTATTFVGNLTGTASTASFATTSFGLSGTPSITVGSITAASATITGNVSVAGTITFKETTNVDSIGVVTARSGLQVTGGSVGVLTSNPRATVQVGTSVSESVFITSTGLVGIGSTAPRVSLDASQETDAIALPQGTTAQRPAGNSPYIRYNTTNSALEFYNGTDWVEIISDYFPTGSTILG